MWPMDKALTTHIKVNELRMNPKGPEYLMSEAVMNSASNVGHFTVTHVSVRGIRTINAHFQSSFTSPSTLVNVG